MAWYSKRHYARVSPPADTPEAIQERIRFHAAAALGIADRQAKYPEMTAENAAEAIAYQEARIQFHVAAAGIPSRRKTV